ncbi:MAG: cysteine--tRNA ligase [Candidatus Levyibacteriota bacterium]
MALQIFNSLSRSKQDFVPLTGSKVRMYVCGITPNNATHLGHAFTYVSFDALVRYLQYKNFEVDYLQNATDINDSDDVIAQAESEGKTWQEEADFWIKHFHTQMDTLNVFRPTRFVLATSVIDKIIEVNSDLLKKGFAYTKNGSLYFDITKFTSYGRLSRFSVEQMLSISRERGGNPDDPNKKNPLDFVLWFGTPDEPSWDTPFGKGRPGWHIECSTMIDDILGPQIDIHAGGRDLIYPHHESEIAQSESYSGKSPFVGTWMHTAMVLYEGEKMSKSLGNLVLIEDLLKKYSPGSIRWMLLSHHYREPWEFEEFELEQVEKKVKEIKKTLKNAAVNREQITNNSLEDFESLMDDDLNTPKVLELIGKFVSENKKSDAKNILQILGFLL